MISFDLTFWFQLVNLLVLIGLIGGVGYCVVKLIQILRKKEKQLDQNKD